MAPLKEDIKKAFKKGLLPSHLSFLTQTRLRLGRKTELHPHPQRESILCVWYRSLGSVGTFPGGLPERWTELRRGVPRPGDGCRDGTL